jgi:hypothetical protein
VIQVMVVDVDTGCLLWITTSTSRQGSSLAEVGEHRVDEFERLVDFLTDLGTSQDNLAGHEDEEYDLGLHHAVDETREELGLVRAEHVVTACQTFEADRELDVARADNILDLEVGELGTEPELLDDPRIFAGSKAAVIFRLGTSHNHLSTREDQSRCLWLTNTHDDGSETLGVVLGIAGMESNGLEVKTSGEVDGSDNVLKSGHNTRGHLTVLSIGGSRRSSNTVRVFSDLLSALLRGGCSHVQVRALRVGERARGDERLSLGGGGRVRGERVWIHDEIIDWNWSDRRLRREI